MPFSLDDSLELVIPYLSSDLVLPEAIPTIRFIARNLPPVHQAGFECCLGKNETQVDFHQGFPVGEQSLETLARWITTHKLANIEGWDRIHRFCTHLQVSPPPTILEFDLPEDTSHIPVPSVFVSLDNSQPWKRSYESLVKTMELLKDSPFTPELTANLHRCFRTCPEGARVMHAGLMLSRKSNSIKIDIDGLQLEHLQPYLETLEWEGPLKELTMEWKDLFPFVDRIGLSLDIGEFISPRVGLECYIDSQPLPRWGAFLDYLISKKLCTAAKRNALLKCSGTIDPLSGDTLWPGDLIVESLLQPPNSFSVFRRDLIHAKLILEGKRSRTAKAYLRFNHIWARVRS